MALLDSVAGVEPQTETVWKQADRYGVPRMIFANKMDRVGANFDRCVEMIRDRLSRRAFPLQIPVGTGETFTGHIDVITRRQFIFDDATMGRKFQVVDRCRPSSPRRSRRPAMPPSRRRSSSTMS